MQLLVTGRCLCNSPHFHIFTHDFYHSHADSEEKRDDWVAAVSYPRERVALRIPKDIVKQRPLSRPLLAGEKDSPRLDVCEEFSKQARDATELQGQRFNQPVTSQHQIDNSDQTPYEF